MARLKISKEWWTAPTEAENGKLIIVTGRNDLDNVRLTGKYIYRVEVTWRYEPDPKGMPNFDTYRLMGTVNDLLQDAFDRDPVAVCTGIYTGDGQRDWVFYCRSLHIFQRKFNEALATIAESLPLTFHAEEDAEWAEYDEMSQNRILDDEDDR